LKNILPEYRKRRNWMARSCRVQGGVVGMWRLNGYPWRFLLIDGWHVRHRFVPA